MTLVFALITYLGGQKIDTSYFRSIDDCLYYAVRINRNSPIPNRMAGEGVPKTMKYTAVCEPAKVNLSKTQVFN